MSAQTVTYWAISFVNSKTVRSNALVIFTALAPILALPEVVAVLSPRVLLIAIALVASGNIVLRRFTTRPMAFIAPGTTVPVVVAKIDPPAISPLASKD